MRVQELFDFIKKRHAIYERRQQGCPKPWTDDPILQSYRFCNVYRELDTETRWFAYNWRMRNEKDPDLWFASLVFRFINWHETAEEIGYPVPWDPDHFADVLLRRKYIGKKVYSGAYMISTHGVREEKATYLMKSLNLIWKNRAAIRWYEDDTLGHFQGRLMSCFDVGSFVAAQVIADCKYAGEMKRAADWWTFAASGPGSRRGLNRVIGCAVNSSWGEEHWYEVLMELADRIDPLIKEIGMPRMHAQDLQNCLCEFDKYERVRLGEGRPKSKYNGGVE